MNKFKEFLRTHPVLARCLELGLVALIPLLIAMQVFGIWHRDLSIPLAMGTHDEVWQLVLSKMVRDHTWVLETPFMGAPDMAHWQYHSAAQTSSLHSMIMWLMSYFINDAVRIQQVYYLLNFSLIALTSYLVSRTFGLKRFVAAAIAVLYCFTTFRINCMFYSFLSNYAAVPLAFIPVLWIMKGEFAGFFAPGAPLAAGMRATFSSSKFWISLMCVLVVALSDGYYAFFTLLLLGFVIALRAFSGDIRRIATLLAPVTLVLALGGLAVAMTIPLAQYQNSHMDEFYQDGKLDPALMRHPFEAEVYSSSLKLMSAPIPNHRIDSVAKVGHTLVRTSNAARAHPVQPIVPLSTICTVLFFLSLGCLALAVFHKSAPAGSRSGMPSYLDNNSTFWCALILSIFIFLCATAGGIGSFIALVYPTIRAYERFILFLVFSLLLGGGAVLSAMARQAVPARRRWIVGATLVVTVAGLYDQIPANTSTTGQHHVAKFLGERAFVQRVEQSLPAGAMVYQYPHSQYLQDSKYYGWGSFDHIRFYLHSRALRWSNGASKNSPVENWHNRTASMPVETLVREIASVGFGGMVIDRLVLPEPEYAALRAALAKQGLSVEEDGVSRLAYVKLPVAAATVAYDGAFQHIDRVVVNDRSRLADVYLPRLVDAVGLKQLVATMPGSGPVTVERAGHPALFFAAGDLERGSGNKPVSPPTAMAGSLTCTRLDGADGQPSGMLQLTLKNGNPFDLQLEAGKLPFKIGMHLKAPDGTMLRWDDGMRVPAGGYLVAGESATYQFPLANISRAGITLPHDKLVAEFALVQDGHAWFNHINCSVPL